MCGAFLLKELVYSVVIRNVEWYTEIVCGFAFRCI